MDATYPDNDAIKENHNFGVFYKWIEIFLYKNQIFNPYAIDDLSVILVKKNMTFKEKIYHYYLQLVQDRIDVFRDMIAALTEDSKNDAKGSAGDKHETALSMMHIEQEKLNTKLREVLAQKAVLDKIDSVIISTTIIVGSLIKANGIYLYLSVALPKINIEGINIIALSPQSPLGSKLIGNKVGFTFDINSTKYLIEEIS